MKKSRGFSYPMPLEGAEEVAHELSEFGYREIDDPDGADRRRFLTRSSGGTPANRFGRDRNVRTIGRHVLKRRDRRPRRKYAEGLEGIYRLERQGTLPRLFTISEF